MFVRMMLFLLCAAGLVTADHQRTDRGGVFQFQGTKLYDNQGISFLGEAGDGNWRANLTYGFEAFSNLRLKGTAEYLWQKHHYVFEDNTLERSVGQMAYGGTIEQGFGDCCFVRSIFFNGNWSKAFGKSVDDYGAILGSNAYETNLGASFSTVCCGVLDLFGSYGSARYHRNGYDRVNASGWGFGLALHQPLISRLVADFDLAYRRAYIFYNSKLSWRSDNWSAGLFARYTDGRKGLNNDFRWGGEISIVFGPSCCNTSCDSTYTACYDPCDTVCEPCCPDDFLRFIETPAVFRPVTLAIAAVSNCQPPALTGPSTIEVLAIFEDTVAMAPYFSGSNLTYSASGLEEGYTINPTTGVITIGDSSGFAAIVTATNACGSASLEVEFIPPA